MRLRAPTAVLLFTAACTASAQPLYRWTDDKGRVHITDTPPPASARNIQQKSPGASGTNEAQQPFEVRQAMQNFPVTLYTAPACKEACAMARTHLNRRGVPFTEIQVADDASREELKKVSGGEDVPTLLVGRSVHRGYAQDQYEGLLDSARYPRSGLLTPRAQAAPPLPEAEAANREPPPTGPYAPRPRSY
jgi:glutaredoxin